MPVTSQPSRDILAVQYLRAVAALMVVWHHAAGQVAGMSTFVPSSFGTSGVDLFFVISGFIMVVTTSGGPVRPLEFWRRRIVRVVPLYWLLTLAMVAAALVAPGLFKTLKVEPTTLVQSLLFVPHFSRSFPDEIWPLLVPGWTLNFEMFFYLLFGAALVLPSRWRLIILCASLLALVSFGAAVGPFQSAPTRIYTDPMLLEFVAGIAVGATWRHGRVRLPFFVCAAFLGLGLLLLVGPDPGWPARLPQIVGGALILSGALHPGFSAWRSAVWRAIGDSSYSLYLTHLFTLGVIRIAWVRLVPSPPDVVATVVFMALSLVACSVAGWVSYRLLERPLLKALNRRRRPVATPSPETAPTARSAAVEP